MLNFKYYKQPSAMDCGPTCLRMVAKHYNKHFTLESLRKHAEFNKEGVNLLGISNAAENIGFRTRGVKITYDQLVKEATLPAILHWNQNHFVVIYDYKTGIWKKNDKISIADPSIGLTTYSKDDFLKQWISSKEQDGEAAGVALLIEPTPKFYEQEDEEEKKLNLNLVLRYLRNSKWEIAQVFIALFITTTLQLIFPFLTQSVVDTGINTQNMHYITIVLIAQLMLVFSKTIVDFIRSRLLLFISSIINLSLLSDFWVKITRLPISYFDSFHTGDTFQRLEDNRNIQDFLTGTALNTLFSLVNFLIYAVVLLFYNTSLFFIFVVGSFIYFLWIILFLRIRRKMNFKMFHLNAKENNATLQLVQGMQEIKLNGAEQLKRWEWEDIQAKLFKLNLKNLSISQVQQSGALLINQGKDILITFIVAKLVMEGNLTIGAMLAVQYIIGQLSSPIEQFVGFVQSGQDAKISLERLNEIHELSDEDDVKKASQYTLPSNKTIIIENFSFRYPRAGNESVLKNINLIIPEGKTTAIVGTSGSGKTTLLKLLLKFYDEYTGEIRIGESNIRYMNSNFWRKQCGVVLQDGFIFNDSIAKNIAVGDEEPDLKLLMQAAQMANIQGFIDSLPNGYNTKLGSDGMGISQGQKQRLLIARAVYKNPHYLFFDEATNALDANNEKAIVENMKSFFVGRTVVIVAHRLSTVKNADKIVVLDGGVVVEEGSHEELSKRRGKYFELVKNQLELGS